MDTATPDLSIAEPEKSSDRIEREMEITRESITEKVAALENQVLGTIQTATDTVTGTVDAVKEAVTTAPTAIRETFSEIVDAVKEKVESFSVAGCIRAYPVAAIASTAFAGFLTGWMWGGRRRPAFATPMMAPEPAPSAPAPAQASAPSTDLISVLFNRIGSEVRQLAEHAVSTGSAALQKSFEKRFPNVVDQVVEHFTGSVPSSEPNGTP